MTDEPSARSWGAVPPQKSRGRTDVLADMDRYLPRQGAESAWVLLTGEHGMGKSVLLEAYRQQREAEGEWVAHVALQGGAGRSHPRQVVEGLTLQVAAHFAREPQQALAPLERLEQLLRSVSREKLVPDSKRLLLMVDGLDEVSTSGSSDNPLPHMLPDGLPPGVQVLCASRSFAHLEWLRQKDIHEIDLHAPRWRASNREVVRRYWEVVRNQFESPLDEALIDRAVELADGNLLYTTSVKHWLQGLPSRQRRAELLPEDMKAFLEKCWAGLLEGGSGDREAVLTGLGLVMATQEPLPLSWLKLMAQWPQPDTQLQLFLHRAAPFLLAGTSPRGEPTWRPYHESFRAYAVRREELGPQGMRAAHERLAKHLAHWPVKSPEPWARGYAAQYAVTHLLHAKALEDAVSLCKDLGYLQEARRVSPAALETSLRTVATSLKGHAARELDDLREALEAERLGLSRDSGSLARLVFNRLLSRNWTRERLETGLRFPEGLPSLRLRHPVQMDSSREATARHAAGIRGCALIAGGDRFLSASEDMTLKLWDVSRRQPLKTLRGHQGEVWACAVTRRGHRAVSASRDETLKVWDLETGECLASLVGHSGLVRECAISEDGLQVLSASDDGTVRLWSVETQKQLHLKDLAPRRILGCAFTQQGDRALCVDEDGTLQVWSVKDREALATLRGAPDVVTGCAWSWRGGLVLGACLSGSVRVWDLETWEQLAPLKAHTEAITDCAMTQDGRLAICVSNDGTMSGWEPRRGLLLFKKESHLGGSWCCALTDEGTRAVCGSSEGSLGVWDLTTRQLLVELPGGAAPVYGCAVTADGRRVFSAAWEGVVRDWDVETRRRGEDLDNGCRWPMDCAATNEGRRVVSGSWDGDVRVWKAGERQPVAEFHAHDQEIRRCALRPDGQQVLTASADGTLKLWDMKPLVLRAVFDEHEGWVNGCALSSDGRRVLSASSDKTLKFWDAETQSCLATLTGHVGPVNDCALTADGRRAISASEDMTLRVWDLEWERTLRTLKGHTAAVIRCAVTPDDRYVFSASDDGTLRCWNLETGECVDTVWGSTGFLSVAVAEDTVCAGDRRGNLWFLDTQKERPMSLASPSIDLAIVVALSEEFRDLEQSLVTPWREEFDASRVQYGYRFEAPGTGHACVATCLNMMGNTPAALYTDRLLARWDPKVIVMLGIAAGIDSDVLLGDVVVADQVDDYLDVAKAVAGPVPGSFELLTGGSVYQTDPVLVTHASNLEFAAKATYLRWQKDCEETLAGLIPDPLKRGALQEKTVIRDSPQLQTGHLASGSIVGADKSFPDWLHKRDRKLKALDMESAGLMAAAYRSVRHRPTLVLRGISDFGDERKADLDKTGKGALRRYAMRNAVSLLWALLKAGRLVPSKGPGL